jgi:O-antigen biosynthesis protein
MAKDIDYYSHVRAEIFPWLKGTGIHVLDIGCGAGNGGEEIKRVFGAHVTGIERDKDIAQQAVRRLDICIQANIEDRNLELKGLNHQTFDYILMLDILEHLKDPWGCLKYVKRFLKKDGKVIMAIPNACNIKTIFEMLKGKWPYEESGIHDNTHLRWFGLQNILELLDSADLVGEEIKKIKYYQFHLKGKVYNIDWKILGLKNILKKDVENLETGHFYVLASKKSGSGIGSIPKAAAQEKEQLKGFGDRMIFEQYRVRMNLIHKILRWLTGEGRR